MGDTSIATAPDARGEARPAGSTIPSIAGPGPHSSGMLRGLRKFVGSVVWPRPLPDFLILGAQKAGTTSLYRYLLKHPSVVGPRITDREEVHFFDFRFQDGLDCYRWSFPRRLPKWLYRLALQSPFVVGEASPYYVFHPLVPLRVTQTLPGAKFILLLRNPIHRAYSHYSHMLRVGRESLTFPEALAAEEGRLRGEAERIVQEPGYNSFSHCNHSYVSRGIYADQIEFWYRHSDRSQFLILRSEDLFADPARTLAEVSRFLNLPPFDFGSEFKVANAGRYPPMARDVRNRLSELFRPHNERLERLLGRRFHWDEE